MLTLGQQLIHKPVLSLRTGAPIGEALEPIINPNNLKIEGWYVQDRFNKDKRILLSQDVREILTQGFVVNDHESLSEISELVRLQKTLDLAFVLEGKQVISDTKRKLGKVSDYAFERNGFFIQKIYIAQSMLKSFSGSSLTIDRTQIIEVTQKKIIVKEALVPSKASLQSVVENPRTA